MKIKKIFCILMASFLIGCTMKNDTGTPTTSVQTSVVTDGTNPQPNKTAAIKELNETYNSILFDTSSAETDEYRDSDYFTSYKDKVAIFGDIGIMTMEEFLGIAVDVIALVEIISDHGGFNVHERWPSPGHERSETIWSSYEAKIIETYAGDARKGESIEINYLGGIYKDMLYNYNGHFEELETGAEYLVYLLDAAAAKSLPVKNDDSKPKVYVIWYSIDGYFKLVDEKITISNEKRYMSNFKTNIEVDQLIAYSKDLFRLVK